MRTFGSVGPAISASILVTMQTAMCSYVLLSTPKTAVASDPAPLERKEGLVLLPMNC